MPHNLPNRVNLTRTGAYGLSLPGFDAQGLIPCPETWPNARLEQICAFAPDEPAALTDSDATHPLSEGGLWRLRRSGLEGTFTFPRRLDPDEWAHPVLAGAACIFAHWLDLQAFHAGSVIVGGKAWALLGEKGAGKTTLLAQLAMSGYQVAADDMLVIDPASARAFAGPRCLDLRPDAADLLEGQTLVSRHGERRRLILGMVQPEVPFGGWIELQCASDIEFHKVLPRDRLLRISENRTLLNVLPRDPSVFLKLSQFPFFEFHRPLDWAVSQRVTDRLVAFLADLAQP